jgi:hypothetical protein
MEGNIAFGLAGHHLSVLGSGFSSFWDTTFTTDETQHMHAESALQRLDDGHACLPASS